MSIRTIAIQSPDLRINVHLSGETVSVSVDLHGDSLHKRGIERRNTAAPLKESLAAAMLPAAIRSA